MTRNADGGESMGADVCKTRGIPSIDITAALPTPEVVGLVPSEMALKLRAVPLAMEDGVLTVAMADPTERESIDALIEVTGHQVFPVWSPPNQLEAALERLAALSQAISDEPDSPQQEV